MLNNQSPRYGCSRIVELLKIDSIRRWRCKFRFEANVKGLTLIEASYARQLWVLRIMPFFTVAKYCVRIVAVTLCLMVIGGTGGQAQTRVIEREYLGTRSIETQPALILANMAEGAYSPETFVAPEGWHLVALTPPHEPHDFKAIALKHDRTQLMVIAFAGTDPFSAPDLFADAQIGLETILSGLLTPESADRAARSIHQTTEVLVPQIKPSFWPEASSFGILDAKISQAFSFYQLVQSERQGNLILTGHSLGGLFANIVGKKFGQPSVTFNAPKIPESTLQRLNLPSEPSPKSFNFARIMDPVNEGNMKFFAPKGDGAIYFLDGEAVWRGGMGLDFLLRAHLLELSRTSVRVDLEANLFVVPAFTDTEPTYKQQTGLEDRPSAYTSRPIVVSDYFPAPLFSISQPRSGNGNPASGDTAQNPDAGSTPDPNPGQSSSNSGVNAVSPSPSEASSKGPTQNPGQQPASDGVLLGTKDTDDKSADQGPAADSASSSASTSQKAPAAGDGGSSTSSNSTSSNDVMTVTYRDRRTGETTGQSSGSVPPITGKGSETEDKETKEGGGNSTDSSGTGDAQKNDTGSDSSSQNNGSGYYTEEQWYERRTRHVLEAQRLALERYFKDNPPNVDPIDPSVVSDKPEAQPEGTGLRITRKIRGIEITISPAVDPWPPEFAQQLSEGRTVDIGIKPNVDPYPPGIQPDEPPKGIELPDRPDALASNAPNSDARPAAQAPPSAVQKQVNSFTPSPGQAIPKPTVSEPIVVACGGEKPEWLTNALRNRLPIYVLWEWVPMRDETPIQHLKTRVQLPGEILFREIPRGLPLNFEPNTLSHPHVLLMWWRQSWTRRDLKILGSMLERDDRRVIGQAVGVLSLGGLYDGSQTINIADTGGQAIAKLKDALRSDRFSRAVIWKKQGSSPAYTQRKILDELQKLSERASWEERNLSFNNLTLEIDNATADMKVIVADETPSDALPFAPERMFSQGLLVFIDPERLIVFRAGREVLQSQLRSIDVEFKILSQLLTETSGTPSKVSFGNEKVRNYAKWGEARAAAALQNVCEESADK